MGFMCSATGGIIGDNRNAGGMRRETLRIARPDRDTELIKLEKRAQEKVDEILRERARRQTPRPEEEPAVGERDESSLETIGKDVPLKVGDIMSAFVVTVAFDDAVMAVKEIFSRVHFHHLPVVDDAGCLLGVISDRDFLRSVSPFLGTVNEQSRDVELLKKKVGLIMTRNPVSVTHDTDLADAVGLMNDRGLSCLPVVARGTKQLAGIVTWKDLAKALYPGAFPKRSGNSTDTAFPPGTMIGA